jgi:hypothetical protein
MQGLGDVGSDEGTERRDSLGWPQHGVTLRLGRQLMTEARWSGLGSTGSAVEDWLRQLEGPCGVASQRLDRKMTSRWWRREALREVRH